MTLETFILELFSGELWTHTPFLIRFIIGVCIFLVIPKLSKRIGIPGAVGLMITGFIIGPGLFGILPRQHPLLDTFSEVGKLLILFFAGAEVNARLLRENYTKGIGFSLLTLLLPLGAGYFIAQHFGYSTNASLLIGSLIASHTMLGFPIAKQIGVTGHPSMTITSCATIITDVTALLILALCVSVHIKGFDSGMLATTTFGILAFTGIVLFIMPKIADHFLSQVRDKANEERDGEELLILIALMCLTAFLAELVHLEPIVGAFLAGLGLSSALRDTIVKTHLDAMGQALFMPAFFLMIGVNMDVREALTTLAGNWPFALMMLTGLLLAKFLAAWLGGAMGGFTIATRMNIWSLTMPQVAATLAATIVAYETVNAAGERLIDRPVVNAIMVLVIVTATLGPILTEKFSQKMLAEQNNKVE